MDKTIRTRYFEFSKVRWNWWSIMFSTGDNDARGGNSITLIGFGRFFHLRLPFQIVRPHRTRVQAGWDEATVARIGRDWYWDVKRREFGFSLMDNHLSIRYGVQTDCWPGEKSWGCFLPWSEWRLARHSVYRLDGTGFWHGFNDVPFERWWAVRESVPKASFLFRDYDGAEIVATTYIEEREWVRGVKWFRWVARLTKPRVSRSINIDFSAEVGPEKGSWKGGTTGHSGSVNPGELHESAFRRYCAEHNLSFLGACEQAAPEPTP